MPKNTTTTTRGSYRGHHYEITFAYIATEFDQYLNGADITVDNKPVFPSSAAGYVPTGETENRIGADIRRYIDFLEDGEAQA